MNVNITLFESYDVTFVVKEKDDYLTNSNIKKE